MHTTNFLARLIGPDEVVLAIGILANRAIYKDVTAQLLGNPALVSITGILGLTAGLAILNAHSRWTSDWRSLITLLGWFLTLVGVFRIFAPDLVRYLSIPANNTAITVAGVLLLTSGGILTYQGYAAEPQRLRKET